jgi:hypothetical protein
MTAIIGIAFVVLAVTAFIYSLPRRDRLAPFVGTNWEPYAVVMIVVLLGAGVVMIISGITELAN